MKLRYLAVLSLACALSGSAFAHSDNKKPHCEKKEKDGKVTEIEVKNEKECKKKGGTWSKGDESATAAPAEGGDAHKH